MLVIAVGVLSFGSIGSAASTSLAVDEVDSTGRTRHSRVLRAEERLRRPDQPRRLSGRGDQRQRRARSIRCTTSRPSIWLRATTSSSAPTPPTRRIATSTSLPIGDLIQMGRPTGSGSCSASTQRRSTPSATRETRSATEGTGTGLVDTAAAAPAGGRSIWRCADGGDADSQQRRLLASHRLARRRQRLCRPEGRHQRGRLRPARYRRRRVPRAQEHLRRRGQPRPVGRRARERHRRPGLRQFDLPAVSLAGGDHYVVCADAAMTANCDLDVGDANPIQNGSPDGMRLVLAVETVDALSYEGDTPGSTEGSERASRTSPMTASPGARTVRTPMPTTLTSRCERSPRARRTRARRRRSSSTGRLRPGRHRRGRVSRAREHLDRLRRPRPVHRRARERLGRHWSTARSTSRRSASPAATTTSSVQTGDDRELRPRRRSDTDRIQNGSPDGSGSCWRVRRSTRSATRATPSARPRAPARPRPIRTPRPASASPGARTVPTPHNNADFSVKAITPGATNACGPRRPTRPATAASRRRGSTPSRAAAPRRRSPTRR